MHCTLDRREATCFRFLDHLLWHTMFPPAGLTPTKALYNRINSRSTRSLNSYAGLLLTFLKDTSFRLLTSLSEQTWITSLLYSDFLMCKTSRKIISCINNTDCRNDRSKSRLSLIICKNKLFTSVNVDTCNVSVWIWLSLIN